MNKKGVLGRLGEFLYILEDLVIGLWLVAYGL